MKRAALLIPCLVLIGACSDGGSSATSSQSSDKPAAATAGPTPSRSADPTSASSPSIAPSTTGPVASTTAAPSAKDGTAIAQALKNKIGSVQQVVTITEDNDPNDLIGRPSGYVSGAVIYDSRAQCSKLSVDCGATIEVWPSAGAAKTRSEYIEGLQKGSPVLGTEYHYLNGPALLRVAGKLKPTEAKEYESAFSSS